MSQIAEHVAILASHSLAQATPNKMKGGKLEYYAVLAFPPAAGADLFALMTSVAAGGDVSKYEQCEADGLQAFPCRSRTTFTFAGSRDRQGGRFDGSHTSAASLRL